VSDSSKSSRRDLDFAIGAWALAVLPALMLAMLLVRAIWDVDIFWQLKLGELTIAHGGPLSREPFAASHLGDPLQAVAWLGQVVMAAVRWTGGWTALRIFDAVCWLSGFLVVAAACRYKGAHPAAIAAGLGVAFVTALSSASIRPQTFSALCLGCLVALLRLDLKVGRTVLLATPLLVLWQNLHPSVSIAAVVLAAWAAGGWLSWWFDRTRSMPVAATVLVPIATLAMFVTPDGFAILSISLENTKASLAVGATEWLPMWAPSNQAHARVIVMAALVTAYLAWRGRTRIELSEIAACLALFVMTVFCIRIVLYWAVLLVPVIARLAAAPTVRGLPYKAWLPALLMVAVALLEPLIVPTHFSPTLPLAAIDRLKQEHVKGTIYGDFPFGGPIIDAGYPDWHVAFDGRYYRYSPEEWHFNGDVEGGYLKLSDVIARYHPAAFIIKRSHNGPLASDLDRDRAWKRIWTDGDVTVFVPAKG